MLWAFPARAQTPVVIVVPHESETDYEQFEHRLRSELVAEGFQPVSVEVPLAVTAQTLQRQATRLMSPAAIGIIVNEKVVSGQVWIRGRGTSPNSLRPIAPYPPGTQAPVVFAVRATDVLHGGLLELGYIGTTPEPGGDAWASPLSGDTRTASKASATAIGDVTATPPTKKAEAMSSTGVVGSTANHDERQRPSVGSTKPKRERAPKAWQFRGMIGIEAPLLHFPISVGYGAVALRQLHANWGLGVAGVYRPAVSIHTPQGRADTTQAGLGGRIEAGQMLAKSLKLFEFVESGFHATRVKGDAAANYLQFPAHSYTGYSSLGLGAVWLVNATVGLTAQSSFQLPWRRSDVLIVRTVVAQAAGPSLSFDVGLQLSF